MKIENNTLILEDYQEPLPLLSLPGIVRVWRVPTEYRKGGYFVSVTPDGLPPEIPACDEADTEFLGELPVLPNEYSVNIRQVMCGKVNTKRDAIFLKGVPLSFKGQIYALQTRDAEEILGWIAQANEAAQMPPDTPIPIRTGENVVLNLPAAAIVRAVNGGIQRRKAALVASWGLKDAIMAAATDNEAQKIYESGIDSAWPENSPFIVDGGE